MELVIGFSALLGSVLLLVSAVSNASLTDVITGKAGQIYRKNQAASATAAAAGGGSTLTSVAGGVTAAASGLTNPFPHGWKPNREDLGGDGTFTTAIVAPVDGVVTFAADSFSNWGGYLNFKGTGGIPGLPGGSDTLYFAEGIRPVVGSNTPVKAGQVIAVPAPSPFGNAYGTSSDGSGQIEWGPAQSGVPGTPTDPLSKAVSDPVGLVHAFGQWVVSDLGLAAFTSTSHAGSG